MRSVLPFLACGSWNLRVGRRPDVVAAEVDALLTEHDLDVLTVYEVSGYIRAIRKRLRGRYKVATGLDPSGRDSAIITRIGIPRGRRRVHRLERIGWERKPGRVGLHWPRSAVSQPVGGIRFMAAHMPPPAARNQPRRRAATVSALSTVTRLGVRWTAAGKRWVMAGDWNMRPVHPAAQALAETTCADIKGNGIDWVLSRRVIVRNYRHIEHGNSDHDPILFTVEALR